MKQWKNKHGGFTIVELLIVVVVIAILAAITIVSYNGIRQRAQEAGAKSTVSQAMKQFKSFAVANAEAFPSSITSCPNPVSGSVCFASDNSQTTSYTVDNSITTRSFCFSAQVADGTSYYSDETGQVLPGGCNLQSCYAIKQAGGARGSGTYWIRPTGAAQSQRVYCDMETSGGGWTLLVTNPGPSSSWNATKVLTVNETIPSISTQYSILSQADSIKSNLNNKLNYRLDAVSLGRWGGVWEAPFSNTFTGTTPISNTTNIQQYDAGSWTIDTTPEDNTLAPSNIMPYVNSTRLLTTWSGIGGWYGTIATATSGFSPAPYMNSPSTITNPGIIWYWVR